MLVAVHKEAPPSPPIKKVRRFLHLHYLLRLDQISAAKYDTRKQDEEGTQQNEEYDETDRKTMEERHSRFHKKEHCRIRKIHEIRNLAITTNTKYLAPSKRNHDLIERGRLKSVDHVRQA